MSVRSLEGGWRHEGDGLKQPQPQHGRLSLQFGGVALEDDPEVGAELEAGLQGLGQSAEGVLGQQVDLALTELTLTSTVEEEEGVDGRDGAAAGLQADLPREGVAAGLFGLELLERAREGIAPEEHHARKQPWGEKEDALSFPVSRKRFLKFGIAIFRTFDDCGAQRRHCSDE